MPPRSTRDKGGRSNRTQRGGRNSTLLHLNNTTRTNEMEQIVDIIRPHIVAAMTTIVEYVYGKGQDKKTHENEIGSVKKKVKEDKHHGMHVMGKRKKRKVREGKYQNPGKKPRMYKGTHPWCAGCKKHHQGGCSVKICFRCKRHGHMVKNCRMPDDGSCYECGSMDHLCNVCPKLGRDQNSTGKAQG